MGQAHRLWLGFLQQQQKLAEEGMGCFQVCGWSQSILATDLARIFPVNLIEDSIQVSDPHF